MNVPSIIALVVVGICLVAATVYLVRHKDGCGGSCAGCANCSACGSSHACKKARKKKSDDKSKESKKKE